MRTTPALFFAASKHARLQSSKALRSDPIIRIKNATFYRRHPSETNPEDGEQVAAAANKPLFQDLSLEIPSFSTPNQCWAILSPNSTIRTTFLQILRGQLLCFPPTARTFPHLLSEEIAKKNPKLRSPGRAIEYVGFDVERQAFGGAYLSARFESRVEETDFTLSRYLTGITNMNPGEEEIREKSIDPEVMRKALRDLELERFMDKPVSMLSNGQSRRARIGKALLGSPELLCLDAPFIGLDPFVSQHISKVLHTLAEANAPRIVLSLRPQDAIPEWITHIVYAGEDGKVQALGPKEEVFQNLKKEYEEIEKGTCALQGANHDIDPQLVELREVGRHLSERGDLETSTTASDTTPLSRDGYPKHDVSVPKLGEPVVEMQGVRIQYGTNAVLGDWQQTTPNDATPKDGLWWTVKQGQRWGIFGPNGSGKSTLLSLVTSDHPQTYSAPVKLFGRSRLPSPGVPGISIFDIQSRIGHASPEVHALFPKYLSVRRALESAWSDTPITHPRLDGEATARVEACLTWFEGELNPGYQHQHQHGLDKQQDGNHKNDNDDLSWATKTSFSSLSFSSQRTLLFLRAVLPNPPILILDEAFSGIDDLVRDKCMLFLSHGETLSLRYNNAGGNPTIVQSRTAQNGNVVMRGLRDEQVLLCVSHAREEVPGCVREWVCLPESGDNGGPRFGRWGGPVGLDGGRWGEVWGV